MVGAKLHDVCTRIVLRLWGELLVVAEGLGEGVVEILEMNLDRVACVHSQGSQVRGLNLDRVALVRGRNLDRVALVRGLNLDRVA